MGPRNKKSIGAALGAALLLFIGICIVAYPTIQSWNAKRTQTKVIQSYQDEISSFNQQDVDQEREKAEEYNRVLAGKLIKDPFIEGSGTALPMDYVSTLNIKGIMGTISIPKIDVYLPIYHGTNEVILRKGVGHLYRSALPIGGAGNHTVLTGHTALATAKLFSELELMEIGDIFYIEVLDETLAYEVDQVIVVEPEETDALYPIEGRDLVTLITCTPYAINSHRLLVRGTRIPYFGDEGIDTIEEEEKINWLILIVIIIVILFFVIGVFCVLKRKKKQQQK